MIELLAPKERESLKLYAELGNAKDVASILNIKCRTVQYYLKSVRDKLNTNSTQQAIALVFNELNITPEDISPCHLSKQELKVLELIKLAKKDAEIAEELKVSVRTIESQVRSILYKSGLRNKQQLYTYSRLYPEKFTHPQESRETMRSKIINLRTQGLKARIIAKQLCTSVKYVYACKS